MAQDSTCSSAGSCISSRAMHTVPVFRAVGMRAAADAVGDGALARWLTVDVPAAIVNGDRIPDGPLLRRRNTRDLFRR
jgi:hypothetical protein